jgi:CubicO group peptidase (beta-lactamase class C family)
MPLAQDGVVWPTETWPTSSPEAQAMDPARLQEMMDLIDEQGLPYEAVLVVRHGHLVFEAYRNGYDQDTVHHLQSATKSVSSLLIGIAIDQGFLDGVDQKVVDLLPGYTPANLEARKERLSLEHLLTMSAGLEWHETDYAYADARNSLGQMWVSSDAVQHVLDQPMAHEPGEAWAYNSGTSLLLGAILEEATGQDVLAFAREHLFDPLGIGEARWAKAPGNHYHTDGGLYLTPRDMARLGYLMLQGGIWEGRQIIPAEWVARSTETYYQTGQGKGYGYQWWTLGDGIFAAHGHYEQIIYVVPQADLVVVFTGNVPDDIVAPTDGLLYRYILDACTDLPIDTTQQTYADHGFTFHYPRGFMAEELPLPGQATLSDEAGMVQFRFDSHPFELIQAAWLAAEPGGDPAAYLAEVTKSVPEAGIEFTLGESQTWTQDGHQALYQPYDLASEGIELRGATIIWYCAESGRVYILSYTTNPEVPDQDFMARFEAHAGSFVCHTTD